MTVREYQIEIVEAKNPSELKLIRKRVKNDWELEGFERKELVQFCDKCIDRMIENFMESF